MPRTPFIEYRAEPDKTIATALWYGTRTRRQRNNVTPQSFRSTLTPAEFDRLVLIPACREALQTDAVRSWMRAQFCDLPLAVGNNAFVVGVPPHAYETTDALDAFDLFLTSAYHVADPFRHVLKVATRGGRRISATFPSNYLIGDAVNDELLHRLAYRSYTDSEISRKHPVGEGFTRSLVQRLLRHWLAEMTPDPEANDLVALARQIPPFPQRHTQWLLLWLASAEAQHFVAARRGQPELPSATMRSFLMVLKRAIHGRQRQALRDSDETAESWEAVVKGLHVSPNHNKDVVRFVKWTGLAPLEEPFRGAVRAGVEERLATVATAEPELVPTAEQLRAWTVAASQAAQIDGKRERVWSALALLCDELASGRTVIDLSSTVQSTASAVRAGHDRPAER